jgi:DnaJ-class molecular chaperone
MGLLILILVVFVVAWLISLRLHPFRRCPACNGTGRHNGAIFGYSHRRCRRCAGGGRQHRQGVLWGAAGTRENLPGKGRGGA